MAGLLRFLVGLVLLALIAGFAYWAYQGYSIAKSINVKDYRVAGVGVKEHYSMIPPIPRTITLGIISGYGEPHRL